MAQKIKDIMTSDVKWTSPQTTVTDAARQMRDGDFGSLPIAENDRLVGMVTDRDIVTRCVAEAPDLNGATVGQVMSQKMLYCREEQSIDEVAENMGDVQIRRLPVIDENDRLVGIVSLGDIAARSTHRKAGDALHDIAAA